MKQQAKSSNTAIRFHQEMGHFVANGIEINIVLNCIQKVNTAAIIVSTNLKLVSLYPEL